MNRSRWSLYAQTGGLVLLSLLILPFGLYAIDFGINGVRGTLAEPHYIFTGNPTAQQAIFLHMLGGAVISVLAPVQLIAPLRQRFPNLHRWSGRIIGGLAVITGLSGLAYIRLRGTIGGMPMDLGFTIYGVLMLLAAIQTVRFARARQIQRHHAWALRLFWLAIASWLYRVHYGLWYAATGGLWSNPLFTGGFDLVQNFAFYLPYLIGVQVYLARQHRN